MIAMTDLLVLFREKLEKTGSLDAALLKVVWVAYQRGLADAKDGQQYPQDVLRSTSSET